MALDRPLLRLFFARALYDSGRFDECLKECAHVASSQSGHPGAAVLSLLCLAHNDRMAGLERLSLDGLSDDLHLQGRALFLAEETLQESERPQPKPAWPTASMPWERSNVGRVAGGPPKARGSRDQHRSADSSMERMKPGEWIRRCRMAQGGGLIDRAVVYAEAAMQSGGDDEVRVVLATLYLETERYREVEACLRGFMENDPERNTYVGISRFYRGDFPGATAALHKAEPDSARAAHTLGRAYLAQGKSKEGRCAFVRTALLDGSIPVERVARAYLNGRA